MTCALHVCVGQQVEVSAFECLGDSCHTRCGIDCVMCGVTRTLPLCESSRDDVIDSINTFVSPRHIQPYHCLIISYETFRLHAARLAVPGACDLLICDEVRCDSST